MRHVEAMTNDVKKAVKGSLGRIIRALPKAKAIVESCRYYRNYLRDHRRLSRIGTPEQIFLHHYQVNEWRDQESVSGPGSTLQYTENIRREIPRLVRDLDVKVILDAPCGDYNWFRMITWDAEIKYIGGDIVEPLIQRNQSLYGDRNTRFIPLNIVSDVLPKADLWLCRDCLIHLSNRDALLAVDNFLRSDIRYLLTSTHTDWEENRDSPTGSCRFVNLQLPPFNFGKPIRLIDDWIEGFHRRHLALWERETLKNDLRSTALQRPARTK
jgi:hypothetical protein